jgi:CBS domain containing-hemolysin-like protein
MEVALGFLAVLLLILANGWFVLGEFAYVAARRPQLEEMAAAGDRRAGRAVGILARLSFMLSGAQLGITVTSLLVGYIAEPVFSRAVAPLLDGVGLPAESRTGIALTVALVLSTTAQMVFGELAPKNLGIARPEAFSAALAGGMRVYLAVAGPVIRLFDNASNRLLRAIGIEPVEELSGAVGPEELEIIIQESGRGGALSSSQAALLGRLLGFRTLRAADAMVPRRQVESLPQSASCAELQRAAVRTGFSRFPVTVAEDLDEVAGVVQAKDVLRVAAGERDRRRVTELVSEVLVVPESAQLGPLLAEMRRTHATLAVVIDEYGGTAGVVTLEDIVEEIVGQIRDEYDREEPDIQALPSGAFLAPGSWRPDEVARETGLELPTGDYETVSGLVMERLGRVPAPGDTVELDDLRLQVVAMDGLAVGRVRLVPTRHPPAEPGDGSQRP